MVEIGDINQQRVEGVQYAATSVEGNATINIYNYYYHEERRSTPFESNKTTEEAILRCPYRGLFHFGPNDAKFFFGRNDFAEKLVQATQNRNFLAVLGASGSGKSSVVFAGLVPKLQQAGDWQFTHFRPRSDPFHAISLALVPFYEPNLAATEQIKKARDLAGYLQDGSFPLADVFIKIQQNHCNNKLLLIADQFEEIYTLCDENLSRQFLDCLLAGIEFLNNESQSPLVLVATMRASLLGNALSYSPFADVLQKANIMLGAMTRSELEQVIKKPAENLGLKFEAGLVDLILDDVEDRSGNLPLLEFALTSLWEKQTEKRLTHTAYREIGGVGRALVKYADSKYSDLNPDEQKQARKIFLQLIRLGEETEYTPRVATKEELGEKNWTLIQKLANARLLVTNRNDTEQEIVELIHEALIQHWQQLRQWLDESRESLLQKKRIEAAAAEWQSNGKKLEYLFQGRRLKKAKYFQEEQGQEFPLSSIAKEFIQTGVRQQRNKKLQVGGSLLIIPLVGIGLWGIVSTWQDRIQEKLLENRLSLGEKILIKSIHNLKEQGSDYFARGEFDKAVNKFKESLTKIDPDDPETLIYLNNANARAANKNPLTIAVSLPIGRNLDVAQEMLRGVAQAQDEVNKMGGINGKPLQVEIGNDDNDTETAKNIAGQLVEDSKILAVVGHNANNVSQKGAEVYQDHLVMISPTSFALDFKKLKNPQAENHNYIFRTVYSHEVFLSPLVNHILTEVNKPKLIICYDSKSYANKLFAGAFSQFKKIKLTKIDCDFSNSSL